MKTSIIILTYNKLDYTKLCIESIRKYTKREKYEIIIIDNNSTDGTVEWIKEQNDIKAILNKENQGFPKGCNQGIEIAGGNNILLLNNDTIVAENWLDNMVNCLYSSEDIGAVGPVTNNCANYQAIPVEYKDNDEMNTFAERYNVPNPELWEQRLRLIGFCMLIKKDIVDMIGLLDERFTPGNFEDDDYSLRIRKAGYKLMLCKDTFIHHYGNTTFRDNTKAFIELLNTNQKKFEDKWGFNPTYSGFIRNDIITMIKCPIDKHINVLEIGCACGATLLKIKSHYKNSLLFGLEINPNAVEGRNDFASIEVGNIEDYTLNYPENFFDYIIFADVLEHLKNPWKALEYIKKFLKDDGTVLCSIPNVMHFSVIRNLIQGRWIYQDAGILDRTHLRFFTLFEINEMFTEAGFKDMEFTSTTIPCSADDEKFIQSLGAIGNKELEKQYKSYQYLIRSRIRKEETNVVDVINEIINKINVKDNLIKLKQVDNDKILELIEKNYQNQMEIFNILSLSYYENKFYDEVLPFLQIAHDIDSQDQDTLYNLGYVLYKFGEKEMALEYLDMIEMKDEAVSELIAEIGEDCSPNNNPEGKNEEQIEEINSSVFIDPTCDIRGANKIKMEAGVVIQQHAWINIAGDNPLNQYMIELGKGTNIGRRCTISASNKVVLGKNVLVGPNVLISDHNHEYRHVGIPIMSQGITSLTNEVYIDDDTWIGANSIIVGNVRIGKGSVIGGNSVVNKDIPDYCVAVGSPAKVVKIYDIECGGWVNIDNISQLLSVIEKRKILVRP